MTKSPDRPRLWVASELYYPEETSTGYFLTRIAEGLADRYDVRVISGRPAYSERSVKVSSFERRHGTQIFRMPATRFDKDIILLRLINLITFSVATFFFSLFHFRSGDLVLVVTNPPTLPLVLRIAGRLRGVWLTLLVHDVYPEVLDVTGALDRSRMLYRVLRSMFRWLYRGYDRIFVLGRDMQEVVERKIGTNVERIRIIPNWGDCEEIYPLSREENAFRSQHNLDGKIVIQFSGNIGRTHDIDKILRVAESLRQDTRFHFLFIGYGGKASYVRDQIEERGLDNVSFLPRQPRDKLNQMLNASDATVIPLIDKMYGLSVPSRMYNVMAAGIPIIALAHPQSELSLVVSENDAGWVLGDDDEALTNLARLLGTSDGLSTARQRGKSARLAVSRDYTLTHVLGLYHEEFEALCTNH